MSSTAFIPYDIAAWRTAFFALIAEEQNLEIPTRGFDTKHGPYFPQHESPSPSETKTVEN